MKKVVLITGASSGIGRAIGDYLHSQGHTVYGTSRNPASYEDPPFQLVSLDVRDQTSIQECISRILTFNDRIDVLINNAGVGITGPIEEIASEQIENNFNINLFGPIEVIKAVLPTMRNQKSGLIINITSIAGYMGLPYRSVYSASKGALELITESLRMELKPFGITACNVAPGDFATNIAAGRYHSPVIAGSPYEKLYQENLDTMDSHVNSGGDPMDMAKMIAKIIHTKNPKIHYKVGSTMQKLSIVLKRVLPDKMYEKMLMKHYGLR